MPADVRRLRIFVSSPSDVQEERGIVRRAVEELNRHIAPENGLVLQLLDWETDVRPAIGEDPQQVITRQIGSYDVLLGVLWHRFGTPTPRAGSGTEEEFRIAYARRQSAGTPEILFYFKMAPYAPSRLDDLEQHKKVFQFRQELQSKGIVKDYLDCSEFESMVRNDLVLLILELHRAWRSRSATQSDLKIGDIEVEMPRPWSSSNVVTCSICYLGKGVAFVRDLGVEVIDWRPCREIKMRGPGAIPEEYRFELTLAPGKGRHKLNSQPFVYRDRDLDTLRVELRSAGGFQYDVRLYAEWLEKRDEEERLSLSPVFTTNFPVNDPEGALRLIREMRPRREDS